VLLPTEDIVGATISGMETVLNAPRPRSDEAHHRASFDEVRSRRDGAARGTSPTELGFTRVRYFNRPKPDISDFGWGEVDLLARSQRNTL